MTITVVTFNDLNLNTVYLVKFSTLQRSEENIQAVSNDGTSVVFQYCDESGNQIAGTSNVTVDVTGSIFLLTI